MKKILIVDDNPYLTSYLEKKLTVAGHEVIIECAGLSAITRLTEYAPDFMFIDYVLPNINGDKLCQLIRRMDHLNQAYLVLMSAAAKEMQLDPARICADRILAKGTYKETADLLLSVISSNTKPHQDKPQEGIIGLDSIYSRRVTKELLEKNHHLQTTLDSISEGILEIYRGQIVYANPAAAVLLNKPQDQFLAVQPTALFPESERHKIQFILETNSPKPTVISQESRIEFENKLLAFKKLPLQGDPETIILLFTDVTERFEREAQLHNTQVLLEKLVEERTADLIRANDKLHLERERLSALVNSITDEIWLADTQGRFTLANPSALREFQIDLEAGIDVEAFTKNLEVLRPDGSPRPIKEAPSLLALGGKVVTNLEEIVRTPATGELRYRQVDASPVRDADGHIIGSVSVVRDITERKRVENDLAESEKRLRFLTSQLLSVQENERRRISLELHDELGQALTAVQLNLQQMEKELPAEAAATRENIKETRSIVEQASQQIRELSFFLRPSLLDDLGLLPTLRWHLNGFRQRTNLEIQFEVKGMEERLDQDTETALYRIIQETLNNIAKHAQAKKVMIGLHRTGEMIAGYIEDDGKGFDVNQRLSMDSFETGIGLIGMRERATLLGGSLTIKSGKGFGTRVSFEIPLHRRGPTWTR